MKGRSKSLIQLRNEHLLKRYYYWYELERLRLDDVLEVLETKEIFLDKTYMLRIISENNHLYKQLKAAKPTARRLATFQFTYERYLPGELFAQSPAQAVAV